MGPDRQVSSSRRAESDVTSIVKRFDRPERVLVLENGRLELITVGAKVIGLGRYAPGWRWSHAAAAARSGDRPPEHVGVVLSGRAKVVVDEGHEQDLMPGDFFHIVSEYDSWVVGYRPCEVLYLSGVEALVRRVELK
jgi:hypothetical protein